MYGIEFLKMDIGNGVFNEKIKNDLSYLLDINTEGRHQNLCHKSTLNGLSRQNGDTRR